MKVEERTLIIIKHITIERGLVGRIIQKFEDAGLSIIAMKYEKASVSKAKRHYGDSKQWKVYVGSKAIQAFNGITDPEAVLGTTDALEVGTRIYDWSVDQLTSDKVIVIVLEGPHAISKVRRIVGRTEPNEAVPGTIRADFSNDSIIKCNIENRALYNVVHRSDNSEEAKHEIKTWFTPSELK